MTIQQPTKECTAAQMTEGGPVHVVKRMGDRYIVLCRGFKLYTEDKLLLSDSKPNCKACLKIKQR
jgi:hypothetical protein